MRYQELFEYKMIKVPDVWDREKVINVFKNPTRLEFLSLVKQYDLRGATDKHENLYLWNAYDTGHDEIQRSMGVPFYIDLYFSIERPTYFIEWENSKKVNGVFVGAYNQGYQNVKSINSKFLRRVLGLKDEKLTEGYENATLSEPHYFEKGWAGMPLHYKTEQIIIQIDNLFFRVVLQHSNLWWGIVPKTKTKNQLTKKSGIMKILVPALKKAIGILISRRMPKEITIDSKTNKGRDLYRRWRNIHPDYTSKSSDRGILFTRRDTLQVRKKLTDIEDHFFKPRDLNESTNKFEEWFAGSKIVNSDGSPLLVYHGTNQQFDKFSLENAAQNIIWFSSNRDKIERGESGAASSKIIRTAYLKITNPAGWEEYDKLLLDQLLQEGYDGIILDDDYVVFSPEQIWIVE